MSNGSTEIVKAITLADFEIRYANIRKQNPKVKKCSVRGCNNPRDSTELSGDDTCCAYHRILFDVWTCECMELDLFYHYLKNQRARRSAFTRWQHKLGKEGCDKVVLREAQSGINWVC